MKKPSVIVLSILLLATPAMWGQQPRARSNTELPAASAEPKQPLTAFDLDFPGGTPRDLVKAIEISSAKPLNAIIPAEFAQEVLPPMKMKAVTAPQLFEALALASRKTAYVATGSRFGGGRGPGQSTSYSAMTTEYGFSTQRSPTDTSIWCFFKIEPQSPLEPKSEICQYYQLGPYLDKSLKIEDITTAIQTGLKMLGEKESALTMSFHKETRLLIAVGIPERLQIIDEVLNQLFPGQLTPPAPPRKTLATERVPSSATRTPSTAEPAKP